VIRAAYTGHYARLGPDITERKEPTYHLETNSLGCNLVWSSFFLFISLIPSGFVGKHPIFGALGSWVWGLVCFESGCTSPLGRLCRIGWMDMGGVLNGVWSAGIIPTKLWNYIHARFWLSMYNPLIHDTVALLVLVIAAVGTLNEQV